MKTTLYNLRVYNASSLQKVRSPQLQTQLSKHLKGVSNTPLAISTTPLKFDALPSAEKILRKEKPRCFSTLLTRIFSRNKPEHDALQGKKLIIQAGYHATSHADSLLQHGLTARDNSDAFAKGNELEGEGLYVAESEDEARCYLKEGGKILEVWLSLDADRIDSDEIQKTRAHDLVIREQAFNKVFFVEKSNN